MGLDGKYEAFGRCIDRCESYIERRFACAVLFSEAYGYEPFYGQPFAIAKDASGAVLLQQAEIEVWRVDFAFVHGDKRIAIECDGHDFHDGSKEQAERDRARDRRLLQLGWQTARFTGREIVRNALACVDEAHKLLLGPAAYVPPKTVPARATLESFASEEEEVAALREAVRRNRIKHGLERS